MAGLPDKVLIMASKGKGRYNWVATSFKLSATLDIPRYGICDSCAGSTTGGLSIKREASVFRRNTSWQSKYVKARLVFTKRALLFDS